MGKEAPGLLSIPILYHYLIASGAFTGELIVDPFMPAMYRNKSSTFILWEESQPPLSVKASLAAGDRLSFDQFLEQSYAAVRKAGGLCIADEVQVGCGRVGKAFWGFQLHGVIPDIVTFGKPIGNGHPLAAVVCTREVADNFANGMEYFNTFGGNPVSCITGTEVLRVVREEKLQENALAIGNYLKSELRKMQKDFPVIGDVRGQGLFLGIELTDSDLNPQTDKAAYLANRMKELGILMSTDGKDVNVMKIKPPLVFSLEHADQLLDTLQRVFREDFMQL